MKESNIEEEVAVSVLGSTSESRATQNSSLFHNAPVNDTDNIIHLGVRYTPYITGSCGWLSALFDHLLEESKIFNANEDKVNINWVKYLLVAIFLNFN